MFLPKGENEPPNARPLSARLNRAVNGASKHSLSAKFNAKGNKLASGRLQRSAEFSRFQRQVDHTAAVCQFRSRNPTTNVDRKRVLEVECHYDGKESLADSMGRIGAKVRPCMRAIIGPLATLFRWYSKRSLDDRLVEKKSPHDAPPVPIAHSWSASGKEGVDYHMNMALDPVISFQEFVEMLEDFGVVPHLIRRSNVKRAFRIVCGALTPHQTRRTPNPHPEDLRYNQFCDLLVRVALAGFSHPEAHLEYPSPTEKLRAMMGVMQLRTCRPKHLRDFLDLLAKRSSSRGCRRTLYKWNYVDCEDVIQTSENCVTEDGWWAYSEHPAPQYLIDILKEHDVATGSMYLPDWRHFHFPMLDMGCICPKDCKHYRILVRNRGAREVDVGIDVEGMPFGTWSYSEKPLASGIGRVIDVEVNGNNNGETIQEYVGEVRISAVHEDPAEGERREIHTVPVYARFEPWMLERMKGCVHGGA